jgi:hypothetical protein
MGYMDVNLDVKSEDHGAHSANGTHGIAVWAECHSCPDGAICDSEANQLVTLKIELGHYRHWVTSYQIEPCRTFEACRCVVW